MFKINKNSNNNHDNNLNNNFYIKNNDILSKKNHNNDKIYLVYQFFIHNDNERYSEIKYCLKKNIELGLFHKIILLNERIYSKEELGLNDNEMKNVIQYNIINRLKFNDIFKYANKLNLNGYIVSCNSDIFFDKSILNVRKSNLSLKKSFYTLSRYEYSLNNDLKICNLYEGGLKGLSQDTWIYHTLQLKLTNELLNYTDFFFGIPGCDNFFIYTLVKNGYTCYNVPINVKTYHYHTTQIRNYTKKDRLLKPYGFVLPITK